MDNYKDITGVVISYKLMTNEFKNILSKQAL